MLPENHKPLPSPKTGILIANLGTPDGYDYWSMRRYLDEFLSDRRVIDLPRWKWLPILKLIILTKRPFSSGAAYKSIWNEELNESPLMTITRAQTGKLRDYLVAEYGDSVMVDFCMRYGNPSTESKVAEMIANGCERILFFPHLSAIRGAQRPQPPMILSLQHWERRPGNRRSAQCRPILRILHMLTHSQHLSGRPMQSWKPVRII